MSIEEELDALKQRIFDLEEENKNLNDDFESLKRRIVKLEDAPPLIKKQRKEVVRFEEIPDTLDYHQLRRLILSYGSARIFVSRTIPRYAEATYKNNGDSDAIIDDAEKLGMKIYYM